LSESATRDPASHLAMRGTKEMRALTPRRHNARCTALWNSPLHHRCDSNRRGPPHGTKPRQRERALTEQPRRRSIPS
jgi:hypothetical protein